MSTTSISTAYQQTSSFSKFLQKTYRIQIFCSMRSVNFEIDRLLLFATATFCNLKRQHRSTSSLHISRTHTLRSYFWKSSWYLRAKWRSRFGKDLFIFQCTSARKIEKSLRKVGYYSMMHIYSYFGCSLRDSTHLYYIIY